MDKATATSGLTKHGEIRDMLKKDLGMGHGDANTLVHVVLKSDGASAAAAAGSTTEDVLAAIYTGPKAHLRPIHDRFMQAIAAFGRVRGHPEEGLRQPAPEEAAPADSAAQRSSLVQRAASPPQRRSWPGDIRPGIGAYTSRNSVNQSRSRFV